jgi:hypothetical protein
LGTAVAAVVAAVLLAGALIVTASLILAAIVAYLCVVAFGGARRAHVPRSRHRYVGRPERPRRQVIEGTATVVKTTEPHSRP